MRTIFRPFLIYKKHNTLHLKYSCSLKISFLFLLILTVILESYLWSNTNFGFFLISVGDNQCKRAELEQNE